MKVFDGFGRVFSLMHTVKGSTARLKFCDEILEVHIVAKQLAVLRKVLSNFIQSSILSDVFWSFPYRALRFKITFKAHVLFIPNMHLEKIE